jgi:hypothetical protein
MEAASAWRSSSKPDKDFLVSKAACEVLECDPPHGADLSGGLLTRAFQWKFCSLRG